MNPSPETSRRLLLAAVLAALSGGHAALAAGSGKKRGSRRTPANNQARDIDALVHELDYLIEVARNLQSKHGGDSSRIRFNYPALLAQLTAARDGCAAYLEDEVMELHAAPPAVIKSRPLVSP
ncbi:RAQPRD family integrative conjugative element protein [uncultured Cardiobacterium sp.]|uniref:RAQPRD family integrative conjugative element protein n=1 Tax=uncultured Cardiobacterium sp. TaxID=417619 RepID=UPI00261D9BBF|nr:RAQPRD family integrative conjugative element protein [uncultured Cardiobacterium sp.]